jgi:hypothetical protein
MNENKDLFGKKHVTLWRISMWSNVLAPILLFISILVALGYLLQYSMFARNQYQTDLVGLFSQNPLFILDVLLEMAREVLYGAVCYLALKGIALGLDIIIETDINYREKRIVGGEE